MGREKRPNRQIAASDIHRVDSGGGFDGIACCESWPEKILTFLATFRRKIIRSEEDIRVPLL